MRRGLLVVLAVLGVSAPAAALENPPYRQPCKGSWNAVASYDWGSAWLFHFEGDIACGINVPQDRPSQMNLRIPKDSCNGGVATGGVEIRTSDQDVWAPLELTWAPGGGVLTLSSPDGHGAAYVLPYHDIHTLAPCPVSFAITAAFVYNTLDGIKIPPL